MPTPRTPLPNLMSYDCTSLTNFEGYTMDTINKIITYLKEREEAQPEKPGLNTSKVTRVEVIDHTNPVEHGGGRAFTFRDDNAKVETMLQDDGRTLKVFISNAN